MRAKWRQSGLESVSASSHRCKRGLAPSPSHRNTTTPRTNGQPHGRTDKTGQTLGSLTDYRAAPGNLTDERATRGQRGDEGQHLAASRTNGQNWPTSRTNWQPHGRMGSAATMREGDAMPPHSTNLSQQKGMPSMRQAGQDRQMHDRVKETKPKENVECGCWANLAHFTAKLPLASVFRNTMSWLSLKLKLLL
jgi:hypothetical protein